MVDGGWGVISHDMTNIFNDFETYRFKLTLFNAPIRKYQHVRWTQAYTSVEIEFDPFYY